MVDWRRIYDEEPEMMPTRNVLSYPFPLRAPPEAMIVGARKAEQQADGKWRIFICIRSTLDGAPTWGRFGQGNYATREEAVATLKCADPDLNPITT